MAKQYNILKADPTGSVFEAHGMSLQSFFLKLENIDKTVLINRKAGSPLLSGPTWLELTETPSKNKPGTTYYKAKLEKAPEGWEPSQTSPQAVQATLPLETSNTPVRWGEALLAASMQVKDGDMQKLLSYANDIFLSTPPDRQLAAEAEQAEKENFQDTVLGDVDEGEIDLSELPF